MNQDVAVSDCHWIGQAVVRHIQKFLMLQRGLLDRFDGFNEANIVAFLLKAADGQGFNVWLEKKLYSAKTKRADLLLRDPSGNDCFVIEVKVIYDSEGGVQDKDGRLNRVRFLAERSILKDFDLLSAHRMDGGRKVIVWVVFSPHAEVIAASDDATLLRYGDIVREVEVAFPTAKQVFTHTINCGEIVTSNNGCRFSHVSVWSVD